MKRALGTVLMATLVVLAGCTGGMSPLGGTSGDGTGTVTMYVSDQPKAIEDFEHLNVTITRVGFHQAGEEMENGTDANESENESDANESEDGDGEWVTRNVSDRTVDLTELKGANATRLADYDVPNGEYDAVFVYVSDVNGTLKNGETVNVKLPSGKLKINEGFTVGANSSVDFVFDITVVKAGQSGKYVLQPVVSESGTDVEIKEVGDDDEDDEDDERSENAESALDASFVGNVSAGENATVEVTRNGSAVANATVEVNGETVGTTNADGELTFTVPDGEELEVTVESGDAEVELEQQLAAENGSDAGQGSDG